MTEEVSTIRLKSFVVEDNISAKQQIEEKLKATHVFRTAIFDSYRNERLPEIAEAADIVSLSFDVNNSTIQSVELCEHLKRKNPSQSIIFFTSQPAQALTQPVNFVLDKTDQVWNSYEKLLLKIFIHDRSLSFLKKVMDLEAETDQDPKRLEGQYFALQKELQPFWSSLLSVRNFFENEDSVAAGRYDQLTNLVGGMQKTRMGLGEIQRTLFRVQVPLMKAVLTEFEEIKQTTGVHVTPKLKSEIVHLRELLAHQEPGHFRSRMRELANDAIDRLISIVSRTGEQYGEIPQGKPELERTEEDSAREEQILNYYQAGDSDESYKEETDQNVPETKLYLNAWFPDYADKDKLKVGIPARLLINLAYERVKGAHGLSDSIPALEASAIFATTYVDVMVICPNADIDPFVCKLPTPPSPTSFVEFNVTPHSKGPIELTIVLLVRNESIYRTVFYCQADDDKIKPNVPLMYGDTTRDSVTRDYDSAT